MPVAELAVWAMWGVTVTLALVLYIRVDIHDWGMVGMTIFLFGAAVLLSRSLLRYYGQDDGGPVVLASWRALVLIGAPVAITGYLLGLFREPPPWRQVVGRLAVLGLVGMALILVSQG